MKKVARLGLLLLLGWGVIWSCGVDTSIREYLSIQFWLPFAKDGSNFARKGVPGLSAPYAGMASADGATPLARLRAGYQGRVGLDDRARKQAFGAARAFSGLTAKEREEVELLDAKFDMRAGSKETPEPLLAARRKFQQFLKTARTPEYLSEARGWLAYTHYLLNEQSAAGKIYLDELNRGDSNLSRDVLLSSLRLTYGHDGGPELRSQLQEYFDTPEHAAFAINMVTNPRGQRRNYGDSDDRDMAPDPLPYGRLKELLEKHAGLLRSERGANALAVLAMRVALRAGDPPAALRLAANVPAWAEIRNEPDFLWMLGSARFLSKNFAAAAPPLLKLFGSPRATPGQKAAAAYGLTGVYRKTDNPVEQLRFALWLRTRPTDEMDFQYVYWGGSGMDLALLLDAEAPLEALREFLARYPGVPGAQQVRYSLAVRLAREHRYTEAEQEFAAINARLRARRMREIGALYAAATQPDAPAEERLAGKYKLAEYLSQNSDRIYFNDRIWDFYQRYGLAAGAEQRFTREERAKQIALERKLKDDQEELWRAHLLLREVVSEAGPGELGRKAANLAIRCLRRLSERFERADEIRAAEVELTRWLRQAGK